MKAVVVALGKIGLPLAAQLARHGHEVVGCDVDPRVVEAVNAGRAPFPGEPGLDDVLAGGGVRAVLDTTAAVAAGPDLVLAVPPLVVDAAGVPDFSVLDAVAADIGAGLRPGTVVCFETTLPLGTTRARLLPALAGRSGIAPEELLLAFSPERVSSGRVFADLETYPKLVGGVSARAEAAAAALYEQFLGGAEVRRMGSAEAAELVKLAETTYRNVNIAFANELARHADAHGLDAHAVIAAANSQPYSHIHTPGVAVGGHCIPVYPHFYLAGAPEARLPRVALDVNAGMPAYAVELLAGLLGPLAGARVAILGVAYRGGVKETAFSGAFAVRDELRARGARPLAHDPLYDARELCALGFEPWPDGEPVDGAIVQTDHARYRTLTPGDVPGARAVVDGRAILEPAPFHAAGVPVKAIGRPA